MNYLREQGFLLGLAVMFFTACGVGDNEPIYKYFAYVTTWGSYPECGGIPSVVFAFEIDEESGGLTSVMGSPFYSGGPVISIGATPSGKFIVTSTDTFYFSVLAVDPVTGALTYTDSPDVNIPGLVATDPLGRFVYVQELSNRVRAFRIDAATGVLNEVAGSPFVIEHGVRSMVGGPSGRYFYVSHSYSGYSEFIIDPSTGELSEVDGSPFVLGRIGALAFEPSGRFVYMKDYSSKIVSVYAVDAATGVLTEVPDSPSMCGDGSGGIVIGPSGRFAYVVNRDSDNISAYAINIVTGLLAESPGSPYATGDSPGSLAISPSGEFAYLVNHNAISIYVINPATGALAKVDDIPVAGGYDLRNIIVVRVAQQGLS